MKKSHPILTPSGVLGTMAKLIRLSDNEDVEWSHWQHPTNNVTARRNLGDYLKKGCPKVNDNGDVVTTQLPEDEELTRLLLGDDYIKPEEVAKARGFTYTEDQLEHFADTLPTDLETILWLRQNGFMLVAGPPDEVNLLGVRELDNQLFYSETEGWYAEGKQKFSRDDKLEAGRWVALRKEAYPNSFSKTWDEQKDLLDDEVEYVPNVAEDAYGVTTYYKVRGVYLRKNHVYRTSSVSADGHRVHVGNFDEDGLNVNNYWDDNRSGSIGVSSARLSGLYGKMLLLS